MQSRLKTKAVSHVAAGTVAADEVLSYFEMIEEIASVEEAVQLCEDEGVPTS
eukprot:COSAG01_NODE_3940_length_5513_cov_18.497968_8_plen_52_part_00